CARQYSWNIGWSLDVW
nr:immunoglobulin heavy chain junction region [Macaca mulatta]MOW47238.1 immunoglobulin heavy chain junction region [Macaca mulatta]MOW48023.1 immunoglobulin heavy chain junction region [Macaca mulatta]MOW48948.1 immunoglobulin heavy chain junction region [Macaca mulatta]MOW49278.1 immunoglobulin heavy chain junction region [Macaca mulatta]